MKKKGTRFERALIDKLWEFGFAAVRVAGSGMSTFPAPDIVAGNGKKILAIEVKMRKSLPLYLSYEEIKQLKIFSEKFGAEPFVALKLPRKDWKFFSLDLLESSGRNYRISNQNYDLGVGVEQLAKI